MRYENAISPVSMVNDCLSAGLVGVGWAWSWQLQRLQWKNDLIASFESRAAAPPIAVPTVDTSLGDVGLDDVEGGGV